MLLMENINDEILKKLNLSRANFLYNTGDEIYILATNNNETVKSLMQIKEEYNEWARERFGNSLYMTMAYKPKMIYTLFKENHNQRQFLNEVYSKLMMDKLNMISEFPGYVNSVSDFNFNDMGERLAEQDIFFSVTDIDSSNAIEIFSSDKNKKKYLLLMSQQELEKYDMTHLKRVYSQNKVLMHPCESIRLWMPDYSYNATIDISDTNENGKQYIGILKIKVDNLSEAFSKGFAYEDKRYATLGRYAALARNINFFFKIIISKICKGELLKDTNETLEQFHLFDEKERKKRKERKVKIVYSLCGEICLVGDSEDLLELAVDIQRNFASFTNNQLTLSAALGVFSKNFSVKKMLELIHGLEKFDKNNANDSIAFFIFEKDNTNDKQEVFTPQICQWKEFIEDVCEIKISFLRQKFKNDISFLYKTYILCTKGIYGFEHILGSSMKEKQYYGYKEQICNWMKDYDDNRTLKVASYLLFYHLNKVFIKTL